MTLVVCRKALLMGALVVMAAGMCLMAQDSEGTPPGSTGEQPRDGRAQGGSERANRPPRPPLEVVLDANGDGVIGAAEISGSAAALRKLDKNEDGKLTPDEYRPPRPPRQAGQGPGPQGDGREGSGRQRPGEQGAGGQEGLGGPDGENSGQGSPRTEGAK